MKCPACYNELVQKQVGNVSVDVCEGGCGGIWFDAFELQRVDEEQEPAGEHLLEVERDARITIDPARKRPCPRRPSASSVSKPVIPAPTMRTSTARSSLSGENRGEGVVSSQ